MFAPIFLFELRYRLQRPATYVYFVVVFLIGLLIGALVGGALGTDGAAALTGGGKNLANSPYNIHIALSAMISFSVFIVAAIMGVPVYRDFEHNTHSIFFTKPIGKGSYLWGRFLGSFVVLVAILLALALGMLAAQWLPGIDSEKYGPFRLYPYIHPYLVTILPNSLLVSALFFCLVALTRNQLLIYLNAIVVLVLVSVAQYLASEIDNKAIAGLLDPFGDTTLATLTEKWTVAERNSRLIPLEGTYLTNRLIWMGVSLAVLAFTQFKFSFSFSGGGAVLPRRKAEAAQTALKDEKLVLPPANKNFGLAYRLQLLAMLFKREFRGVASSPVFIAIGVVYLILMGFGAYAVGLLFETPVYPVTYQMLDIGNPLLIFAVIVFYSGEMVWAERSIRVSGLYDTLPVPNWLAYVSKLLALLSVIYLMQALAMVAGMLVQTFKGYFNYEIGLYFKSLFFFNIIGFVYWTVLAFFIQAIAPNKFLGFFIFAGLFLFINTGLPLMGLEQSWYRFNAGSGLPYSDMNGYGQFVYPFLVYKAYWGALVLFMAGLTYLLWPRGAEQSLKVRWKNALPLMGLPEKAWLVGTLAAFIALGVFVYYNTNILVKYRSSKQAQKDRADFEKSYKKYDGIPQPKITDIKLTFDLLPKERSFSAKGVYTVKNKHSVPIDSVHVLLGSYDNLDIRSLAVGQGEKVHDDEGYFIFRLPSPLQPGDSTQVHFDFSYRPKGFQSNPSLVYNGTFLNNTVLPSIGYDNRYELSDEDQRKKNNLPPRERMPLITDESARNNNFISKDADWMMFEATVSTDPDQVAVVPGYLQREWEENGRRYFHYKMDAPMVHFYNISSARYEVLREQWTPQDGGQPVSIEIYYHKTHAYNVDRMARALKRGLDYFTTSFGPYQHRQVRILEFPRYSTFAQSFANTIPYSEAIGFIADVDDKDDTKIDYPFYVVAHELAHQWWGHQVIGGYMQGCQAMSESMSQYSSMMVMEHEYGENQMKKFLKLEMNNYLRGRAAERRAELPLLLSENQNYIHYNKGSVVMYALKDYLGEDSLNMAMRRYVEAVKFQEPPYTTSLEWAQAIYSVTPPNVKQAVTDMLEDIVLFDFQATAVDYEEVDSTNYKVTLAYGAKKLKADGQGEETEILIDDYVDVAVFAREKTDGKFEETPLYFEKHHITQDSGRLEITVAKKPYKAGIDPYNKLIDRKPDDNTRLATEKKE